jgi:hypothetical protein
MAKERYITHFLALNGMEKKVFYHTSGENLKTFLNQSDYFLTTEIQPGVVGLLESLSLGLKPLIRFSLGQNEYTPENTMWKNFSELPEMYDSYPDPLATSGLIQKNNDPDNLVGYYIKVLTTGSAGA